MSEPELPQIQPIFPPELERVIFEIAARSDNQTASRVGLVAVRVREWVLPIKYEILAGGLPQPEAISVIGKHVRHLLVRHEVGLSNALTHCSSLENLAVWTNLSGWDILRFLNLLPLRKLSAWLDMLFVDQNPNFGHYPFSHLTHLELLKQEYRWSYAGHLEALGRLPNLTHLAYSSSPLLLVVEGTLEKCKKLRVLILLSGGSCVGTLPERDFRVVATPTDVEDWDLDWRTGAKGGPDFWVRAEEIVAARYTSHKIDVE